MKYLIVVNKDTITYDTESKELLVGGKPSVDYSPAFIGEGDGVTFIGVLNNKANKFYNLNAHEVEVVDEDNLGL